GLRAERQLPLRRSPDRQRRPPRRLGLHQLRSRLAAARRAGRDDGRPAHPHPHHPQTARLDLRPEGSIWNRFHTARRQPGIDSRPAAQKRGTDSTSAGGTTKNIPLAPKESCSAASLTSWDLSALPASRETFTDTRSLAQHSTASLSPAVEALRHCVGWSPSPCSVPCCDGPFR